MDKEKENGNEKQSFLFSKWFMSLLVLLCIGTFGLMGYAITKVDEDITQFTLYTNQNLGNKENTEYYVEFHPTDAIVKNKKVKISKDVFDNLNKEKKFKYHYDFIHGSEFTKINDIKIGG